MVRAKEEGVVADLKDGVVVEVGVVHLLLVWRGEAISSTTGNRITRHTKSKGLLVVAVQTKTAEAATFQLMA